MAKPQKAKRKKTPKTVLNLPDLEQSKSAVLNSLSSSSSQRSYDHAIREFIDWHCSEPRLVFNKTVVTRYRISLEQRHYAPSTINLRLAAVRRFMGCSTGGHQALSELQRFPADYDGVVAGDPGNNRVHLSVGFLWAFAATHDANGNVILLSSKLPLINKAAIDACDAKDGLKDGIISNPQACHFDPGVLLLQRKRR